MIGTWIGSALLFLPLTAQSSTSENLLTILHQSTTGHEIATKLELLMKSTNPEERVEIAFPDQLSVSEKKSCADEPRAFAATMIGKPTRIFFCKSDGIWKDTIALGHEAVHAITQVLDPEGKRLFQLAGEFRRNYSKNAKTYSGAQLQLERAFAIGFDRLKSLVNEMVAYQIQHQISNELGELFPEVRNLQETLFSLAPLTTGNDRNTLAELYIPQERMGDVIYAYDMLQAYPWVLEDLFHYVSSSNLEETIQYLREREAEELVSDFDEENP